MTGYDEGKIPEILESVKTIAVVGISDKPERDSYSVARYLHDAGYEIVPVNPTISDWNGIKSYPDLKSLPKEKKIDLVDVFRKPDAVFPVVQEALEIKPKVLWLQEGVINEQAADLAKKGGLLVVMDRCMMKEHRKLASGL